mmetsp:Transcript_21478/g.38567  ORF Transcript_21478/g.38567 Transcript_21478/m.38567 type:complete len:102 (-) Transcript_21478:29-334(-)
MGCSRWFGQQSRTPQMINLVDTCSQPSLPHPGLCSPTQVGMPSHTWSTNDILHFRSMWSTSAHSALQIPVVLSGSGWTQIVATQWECESRQHEKKNSGHTT